MAKICLGCLNPLPEGDDTCRVCGFSAADQNPSIALPLEAQLQEHYTVGRMVHEAGDSLFYLGYDKILGEPCFIQEYYPGGLCSRAADGTLAPLGGCENLYADYQKAFASTMRALARVKDLPCIIPIYDIFEQNGTLYTVSDYVTGETLARRLERVGRIPWQEARQLFMPLLTCVEQLASAGLPHLAICPSNILLAEDGKWYLRGFSLAATRQVGTDLTPRLASGYAAPEQYDSEATLGEMTDVYGLAATIFRTVTGNEPPAGNNRADDSDDLFMTAEIAEELTQQVCVALFNALLVPADTRTATAKQLHQQLSMEPNVSALLDEDKPVQPPKNKPTRTLLIVFGSVAAALLVIVAIVLIVLSGDKEPAESDLPVSLPALSTTTTTTASVAKYAVPNFEGQDYYAIRNNPINGKLKIELDSMKPDDKAKGTILSQEPAAGEVVEEGAVIKVVISAGQNDKIAIDDVTGLEEAPAKRILELQGFKVEIVEVYATDVERGKVESTDPVAGTLLQYGDTVRLRVSYAEPTTTETTTQSTTADSTDMPTDTTTAAQEDDSENNVVDVGELFPD